MYFLGFDPGGRRQFGWCVARAKSWRLRCIQSGAVDNAAAAVLSALECVGDLDRVAAAGIDSPLYWAPTGNRQADKLIRRGMIANGARYVGGTVQQVNSLSGACLTQGILTVRFLRERIPTLRITETHPKALLWLLEEANGDRHQTEIQLSDLTHLIQGGANSTQHARDAALGAVAAFAMWRKAPGWRDLFLDEDEPFVPIPPVEYWMPIRKTQQLK